ARLDLLAHRIHRHVGPHRARARARSGAADGRRSSGPPARDAERASKPGSPHDRSDVMTVGSSQNADLQQLDTERVRSGLAELDLLSIEELVALMCDDVSRVPEAVQQASAAITEAVRGVVERLGRGGRLIYVGAGTAGRLGLLDAAEAGPTFNVPAGQ